MKIPFRFHISYFLITILLLITEIMIALFVQDEFLRPYGGDFLVVILIYSWLRSFTSFHILHTAIGVLLFAFTIEFAQYLNFVEWAGLGDSKLASTLIGTSFHWIDMLAYTLGILTVIWIEFQIISQRQKLIRT